MRHADRLLPALAVLLPIAALGAEPLLDIGAPAAHADARGVNIAVNEDFESGFIYAPVLGQNGWVVDVAGAEPRSNANIVATGESGFGDFSLRVEADSDPFGFIRAFAPTADPPHTQLGADCVYPVPEFADLALEFFDENTQTVVTRIAIGDTIRALQLDPVDPNVGVFHETTGTAMHGQVTRLGVRLSGDLRTLEVFQDGQVIFTGHNIAAELFDLGEIFNVPIGITDLGVSVFPIASLPEFPDARITSDNLGPWLTCPTDFNADGVTDTADLGQLIGDFGGFDPTTDINGDGVTDTADLGLLIAAFGGAC